MKADEAHAFLEQHYSGQELQDRLAMMKLMQNPLRRLALHLPLMTELMQVVARHRKATSDRADGLKAFDISDILVSMLATHVVLNRDPRQDMGFIALELSKALAESILAVHAKHSDKEVPRG